MFYQIFDRFDQIDIDLFDYKLVDSDLEIKTTQGDGANLSHIYLKTPLMELGPIDKYQNWIYLELNILDEEDGFKEFLQTIDTYHIAQIHANQQIWGFDGTVPLAYFSKHYFPILKRSTTTYQDCLIFQIKANPDHHKIRFYDQEDRTVSLSDLKQGCFVRAILELKKLRPIDKVSFQTELKLIQMKARLDSDNSDDSE